jgi:8-oxo-dGTP pyrophosphatase MutT (NUDIX family)
MKEHRELHLAFQDTEWPFTYADHDRHVARAVVVDAEGRYYFVRANRDDDFGKAEIIETAGGGVEAGEELGTAIRRELREELGVEVDVLGKLGVVSDYYNIIHRHNINNYFLCRITSFGETQMTEDEKNCFHLSTLCLSYEEAVAEYRRCACTPLGRLIAQRELPMVEEAKRILDRMG